MKKLSILFFGLLLVAALAGAQEVVFTGDATVTFGADLDGDPTFGFENTATSSLSVTWDFDDASSGSQGFINLTGMSFSVASDDTLSIAAPSVEAGFMFSPVTVTIYAAPSFKGGNAAGFVFSDDDDPADEVEISLATKNGGDLATEVSEEGTFYYVDDAIAPVDGTKTDVDTDGDGALDEGFDGDGDEDYVQITSTGGYLNLDGLWFIPDTKLNDEGANTVYQGLTVSTDLGVAVLGLEVGSAGTWEDDENDFAVGAYADVPLGPAALNAQVWYGPTDAADIELSLGATAAFGPATVDAGADLLLGEADTTDWDASVEIGADFGMATASSLTYIWQNDSEDLDLNQQVMVGVSVSGLSLSEKFQMINLLAANGNDLAWYSETSASYTAGGIMPYAMFAVDSDSVIDVTAGVDLSGFVENTVFTLQYEVEDIENSNGVITAAAKISY
jgi:hypothetical protein